MPFQLPVAVSSDRIIDVNSRLNCVNVGTSIIFSRFEFFTTPVNSSDKPRMKVNGKAHHVDNLPKIRLVRCHQSKGDHQRTNSMNSPDGTLKLRKLSVTSNYRHRSPSTGGGILGVPKPPIDRRSKKPSRLKRVACEDIIGYRDQYLPTDQEELPHEVKDRRLSTQSSEDYNKDPHHKKRLITASHEISDIADVNDNDQCDDYISQKELKSIYHIVSEICAETIEPELNLDDVNPLSVIDKIEYDICRPLNMLDPAFSDRLWKTLQVSAGFSNTNTNAIVKAFRLNAELGTTSGLTPRLLKSVRPEGLVQSECYVITSQKKQSKMWTFWEFRKYLPPAKPMGEVNLGREVEWSVTDCTFENIEEKIDDEHPEAPYGGDRLSEESCDSIIYGRT